MKSVKRLFLLIVILTVGFGANLFAQVPPTLLSPQDKDSCLSIGLSLVWQSVPSAVSYKVEVSDEANFSNIVISQSNLLGTTLGIQVSDWDRTYYWRVYAVYPNTEGKSLPFTFKTKKAPVNLVFPSDSLTCADTVITFKWNKSDAEFYTLQVAEDSLFTVFKYNVNNLIDTSKTVVVNKYSKIYYWRVSAKKALCSTDWSAVRILTTKHAPPVHVFPADGTFGAELFSSAPFSVAVKWKKITAATSYNIQISKKPDFSLIFSQQSGLTDTSFNVVIGNVYDSTYYWRVIANINDCQSYWSKATKFNTPYSAPSTTSPLNDESCVSMINNLFKWTTIPTASRYRVQVSELADFSTTEINLSEIDQAQVNIILSKPNTKYYWRVRAEDNQNSGLWSIVRTFKTTQRPPKDFVPANGTSGLQKNLILSWERIGSGNRYDVKVAEDLAFTKIVADSSLIDTNYIAVSMPKNNNEYFWMVRARYNGCIGDWSTPSSFKTILPSPALIAPANNSVISTIYPVFKWENVTDAVTYDIEVSLDSNFTTIFKNERKIPAVEWTFASEKFNEKETYYWRVRSENIEGRSLWSHFFKFSIMELPADAPNLITPENGSVTLPLTTILVWEPVAKAKKYYIEVSKDDSFGDLIVNQELAETQLEVVGLNLYSNYWWRVRSINDGGQGEWSSVYTFRTKDLKPEEPVVLSYPDDDFNNAPISFTFTWSPVERALGYEIQIATTAQFEESNIVMSFDKVWTVNKKVVQLDYDKIYYWRVRAWNEDGKGPWSVVRSFSTIVSSVKDNTASAAPANVYPNPSVKGNTVIDFELNSPATVNVKILNILGKVMLEMSPKEFNSGKQNLILNTANFNPGIYFYSIQAANQTFSGRFIVSE